MVTLPNRTLHTLAVGTATGGAEAYLQGSKPAPACPMIWIAAQQQENVVTASFSSLVGIVQGQTANVTVTLRPSPSPVTVTLSLTTTTGTGSAVFTSTNTNTTSITQTSTITIKGVTASSTANNIRLSASALGSTLNSNLNFSVIWVTIANIYTSGSLQGDDDAANQYAVSNGTTQLNGLGPAYDGAEIKGVVTPSNFTDTITLTQTRVSYACYSDTSNGSTLASSCSNGLPSSYTCPSSDYTQCQVDATGPSGSEDSTPAPNGNIYSWDAPGTTPGSTPNTISRIRQNFAIFAVYKNVTASNVFTWFNRGSAKRNSDGSITWENTYNTSGDNQAGQGNTKTSYNLQ